MEGPYRDLGSGFARLTGSEGVRRNPSSLRYVEDALFELVRNARDAGATRIYVASTLKSRRYRILTVIDDGTGVPESHSDLIFDPGVTSRHLNPISEPHSPTHEPHGAGLSLYHIRSAAVEASLLSAASPTALKVTFDTRSLPERALQSGSRPSRSNLLATLQLLTNPSLSIYLGSQAQIVARLIDTRIIPTTEKPRDLTSDAGRVGLEVSIRTAQRLLRGEIQPAPEVYRANQGRPTGATGGLGAGEGPTLSLGSEERERIADILRRAARASYLEMGELRLESRPGEISVTAPIYEPEEDYD